MSATIRCHIRICSWCQHCFIHKFRLKRELSHRMNFYQFFFEIFFHFLRYYYQNVFKYYWFVLNKWSDSQVYQSKLFSTIEISMFQVRDYEDFHQKMLCAMIINILINVIFYQAFPTLTARWHCIARTFNRFILNSTFRWIWVKNY